ncbi:hypothetical protein OG559_02025 [Micromonospora sp. NBC_01405]|uniref:hypothetical protein n=1 Tax=Micromonospora sp. NBC_01405 TaxID=2903589 RepID=UPI00324AA708
MTERNGGVERIRAALSTYEIALGRQAARRPVLPAERLAREVTHAWTTFQRARYPQAIDLLPQLLTDAAHPHRACVEARQRVLPAAKRDHRQQNRSLLRR